MVAQTEYHEVVNFITSFPKPEDVLAYRASPALQERVEDLIYKLKTSELSQEEVIEMEKYKIIEHIMTMAKKQALKQLNL